MAGTKERPRARFAPIPIETTFESYRRTVPAGELTPSPSPRTPSPPPREKRKFAPQLVESSVRRSRRAGDEGPATRPTDKTDITPYTNHIYAPRPRKRFGQDNQGTPTPPGTTAATTETANHKGHGRRESCDDEIAGGVFDLAAREAQRRDAQRKLQELAMSAFPNSGERIGGAEHFYVHEGSDDDAPRGRPLTRGPWKNNGHTRRNSSEEDISWAFKEMQEHSQMLNRVRSRDQSRMDTFDLDNMSIGSPPSDAMGLTSTQRNSITSSPLWTSRHHSSGSIVPIGESHMPLLRPESPLPTIGESHMPYVRPESPPFRTIGESHMPYIPSAPAGKAGDMPYVPASLIPEETSFGHHTPYLPPISGGIDRERDPSLERARAQHRLRLKSSPPMLGADLTFRRCPSPKATKLEPDHLWDVATGTTVDDHNRDPTEQHGLWRGYCYTHDTSEHVLPLDRPAMIQTPHPTDSPHHNPFAHDFGGMTAPVAFSEDSSPVEGVSRSGTWSVPPPLQNTTNCHGCNNAALPEHRTKSHEPKGLHMLQTLQNLDEKLRREKAAADLEEKIAAEFDDHFVTQVYNYLSLGYPATARQYDEELSKISRIPVKELERDDEAIMAGTWDGDREEEEEAVREDEGYVGSGSSGDRLVFCIAWPGLA
ncbi:hypothetical protein N0V88_007040 [Collariella sp. IMI 366227]|nr:hypothetical protein N0V88_007040 [Collariella sp. IMI 366227]